MEKPDRQACPKSMRGLFVALGILVLVLFLSLLLVSPVATWAANRKLAELDQAAGKVEAIEVHLLRGALEAKDFLLWDRATGSAANPMVRIEEASLNLDLTALFRGVLRGRATVSRAVVAVTKRASEKETKGFDAEGFQAWRRRLRSALPIEITDLSVTDSKIRYLDRTRNPAVNVSISDLQVNGHGFLNRSSKDNDFPTHVEASGITTGRVSSVFKRISIPSRNRSVFTRSFRSKTCSFRRSTISSKPTLAWTWQAERLKPTSK